jgi:hypothetical protein
MTERILRAPHEYKHKGWRFWLCKYCFAPPSLHPRTTFVRPRNSNEYLSWDAPHFRNSNGTEGGY